MQGIDHTPAPAPAPPRRRWWKIVLLAAAGLLLIVIIAAAWLLVALKRPVGQGPAQVVVVEQGAAFGQVARDLEARGLIRSARALSLAARANGAGGRIRFGEYRLSPQMSALEMLDWLARGKVLLHKVTIPEGFTISRIADVLGRNGLADSRAFRTAALNGGQQLRVPFRVPTSSLEGYLFPDTYYLERYRSADDLVRRMLVRFYERVWLKMRTPRAADVQHLSVHQVVTLASLVEGEARRPQERGLIAGVLMNRLRVGQRLECDATVLYAMGYHKSRLTFADLKVESPYNTYLHAGLPPGPINNPGAAAIEAALHPQASPFFYYVARPDGSHIFSRTLSEHLAAIARLKRAGLR